MRHEWLFCLSLLACAPDARAAHDPAYVDSPESRAMPDPARADGVAQPSPVMAEALYAQQQQVESERRIAEQMDRFAAAQAEAMAKAQGTGEAPSEAMYPDPPVGGRDLIRGMGDTRMELQRAPSASREEGARKALFDPLALPAQDK